VKHDDFALDGAGVDGTAVLALVLRLDVSDLQVPFLVIRPHDREPRVVHHPSFLVRQRDRAVVKPRHLRTYRSAYAN